MRSNRKLPKGVSYHNATKTYFGRATVTLRDGTKKREVTPYFSSPHEAADAISRLKRDAKMLTPERLTVEALLGEWMAACEHGTDQTKLVRPKTLQQRRDVLAALLPSHTVNGKLAGHFDFSRIRERPINEFHDADLRFFLERLAKHGVGSRSIQVAYEALRAAYRWAEQRRYVDGLDSPFRRVPKPSHEAKNVKSLTDSEMTRLVKAIDETGPIRGRAILKLMLTTGLRPGEALGLRRENVDFDAGIIRVRGQADAKGAATPLKTRGSERDVPLQPDVAALLRELQTESPLVFATASGKSVSHANLRTKWFQPMTLRANLSHARLTPHKLRSIAATLMAPLVAPATLARIFGWTDGLKTAMKYYVKTSDSMVAEAGKAMGTAIAQYTTEA